MADEIPMTYDEGARTAVLTFAKGRQLKLTNISAQKAQAFREKHAAEFQQRDCCLSSIDGVVTREQGNG